MTSKSLGVLTLDLIAKTGGFESGMNKAGRVADRKLRQMESDAKKRAAEIDKAFSNVAKGITAAWASLKFVESIKGAADFADSLSKLSQRTGDSVKDLSALTYAAKLNDASFQDLDQGLKGLSNKMLAAQAGSAEAAAGFKALGISVTDSNGNLRKAGDVLLDIADRFSGMEDGAGKSAIATRLMEESGRKLIPTLNNGRAGLQAMREEGERFGVLIGDELAAQAVQFNDNLTRFDALSQGLAITIGNELIPVVNNLAGELLDAQAAGMGFFDIFTRNGQAALTTAQNLAHVEKQIADLNSRNRNGFTDRLERAGLLKGDDELEALKRQRDYLILKLKREQQATTTLPTVKVAAPALPATGSKASPKPTPDAASESAKAYADVMAMLDRAQQAANASASKLSSTEAELVRLMSDPVFAAMPETWRVTVAQQADFTLQLEKAAAEQQRLNDLLTATPTAQLEAQRETMQFLANAFEQGRISAEQFNEAASAALGNIPQEAQPAKDTFLDMTLVANDAANAMANAFTNYLFNPMDQSIEEMLSSFLKAVAQMIAQAMILKAVKAGMSAMGYGFADGGVFDQGGVKAFASGGVVTRPTPFKFASGGSFKSGLMGEAGPEAILPLKRGSDGRLGVTLNSEGGASGDTVVNITVNQAGGEEHSSNDSNTNAKALANRIKSVVLEVLVTEKRPGGVLYN